jgi:hypothetical protein
MERRQARRASSIDGNARALQIKEVGDAVGKDSLAIASGLICRADLWITSKHL